MAFIHEAVGRGWLAEDRAGHVLLCRHLVLDDRAVANRQPVIDEHAHVRKALWIAQIQEQAADNPQAICWTQEQIARTRVGDAGRAAHEFRLRRRAACARQPGR
jgi:hypothetical protein